MANDAAPTNFGGKSTLNVVEISLISANATFFDG